MSPERIDAVLERIRTTQQHDMLWIVDTTRLEGFLERLKQHRWQGGKLSIWALDVDTLANHAPFPEGVTVERVTNAKGLQEWGKTLGIGYDGLPIAIYDRSAELIQQYGFVQTPGVLFATLAVSMVSR